MAHSELHSAGDEVAATTQALSNDLLGIEQGVFAGIHQSFVAHAIPAAEAIQHGHSPFPHLDECLGDVTSSVRVLVMLTAALSVQATHGELQAVGHFLDARQAATVGLDAASSQASSIAETAIKNFSLGIPDIRRNFGIKLREQTLRAKDKAEVQLRVFSERPIAGIGMGVWYRPIGWLQAQARASSLWTANHVKMEGIAGMNDAL